MRIKFSSTSFKFFDFNYKSFESRKKYLAQGRNKNIPDTKQKALPHNLAQIFCHLNFLVLRKYLTYYNICYYNDKYICNSCKKAKAIKHYNCTF